MIGSLFRSLETCIHERLAVIEDVIRGTDKSSSADSESLHKQIEVMNERLRLLETAFLTTTTCPIPEIVEPVVPVNKKEGVWIDALKDLEIIMPPVAVKPVVEEETEEEEELVEEEEEEEEIVEEEEPVEEEEVLSEAVEEEEAEEEEEALEEITFKGKTYYKDSDNNIYSATEEEIGDPIGVWDVARARVLFKRVAA